MRAHAKPYLKHVADTLEKREKRAKTNLKQESPPSPPQVNLSLYLYWLANVASMLLAGGGRNTAGEKGGKVFKRWRGGGRREMQIWQILNILNQNDKEKYGKSRERQFFAGN